jgi:hypothetical protein
VKFCGSAVASAPSDFALMIRFLRLAIALAAAAYAGPGFAATGIGEIWHRTHWGEFPDELLRQFGAEETRLPRALDFGVSYADVADISQHNDTRQSVFKMRLFSPSKRSKLCKIIFITRKRRRADWRFDLPFS